MLLVFVNFMFSNVVFIHTHQLDSGGSVTHSHPCLPSSPHNHSAQNLNLISAFNLAAASADTAPVLNAQFSVSSYATLIFHLTESHTSVLTSGNGLRSPPSLHV